MAHVYRANRHARARALLLSHAAIADADIAAAIAIVVGDNDALLRRSDRHDENRRGLVRRYARRAEERERHHARVRERLRRLVLTLMDKVEALRG